MTYMQYVFRKEPYKSLIRFRIFSAAKIPCAIIHGIAKSCRYDVGQSDLGKLRNAWNAVYINGGWRFVYPLWACHVATPSNSKGWSLLDSKGDLLEIIKILNENPNSSSNFKMPNCFYMRMDNTFIQFL